MEYILKYFQKAKSYCIILVVGIADEWIMDGKTHIYNTLHIELWRVRWDFDENEVIARFFSYKKKIKYVIKHFIIIASLN